MDYTYAIEYFDCDSLGSQWVTVQADSIEQAVHLFKLGNPRAKVYAVFVEHNQSADFYEENENA